MIELINGYFVQCDTYGYLLKRRGKGVNKQGEEIETVITIGYFNTLTGAMKGAISDDIHDTLSKDNYDLISAICTIDGLYDKYSELLIQATKRE